MNFDKKNFQNKKKDNHILDFKLTRMKTRKS